MNLVETTPESLTTEPSQLQDKNTIIRKALETFTMATDGQKSAADKATRALNDFETGFDRLEKERPKKPFNAQNPPNYLAFDIKSEIHSTRKLLEAYTALAKGKPIETAPDQPASLADYGADRSLTEHIPDVTGAGFRIERNSNGILAAQLFDAGDNVIAAFGQLHDTFKQNGIERADLEEYSRQLSARATPPEATINMSENAENLTSESVSSSFAASMQRKPLERRSIQPGQMAAQKSARDHAAR